MPLGFAAVLRIDDLGRSRYPHRAVSCGCPARDRTRSAHRARCNCRNRSTGPPARGERGRAHPFPTVGWRSLAPRRTRVRRQRPRTRGVPGDGRAEFLAKLESRSRRTPRSRRDGRRRNPAGRGSSSGVRRRSGILLAKFPIERPHLQCSIPMSVPPQSLWLGLGEEKARHRT
jgi:hypothetical protein